MKTLIVEDDLSLSDVLAFTLRRAGYEVVTAFDGLTALQQWQAEQPDLILLDLNLPRLDGLAVCRQIRSQAQTPIIILSVRSDDEMIVRGLELGADDYMVKPFSPNQLLARIKAVLRRAGVAETAVTLEAAGLAFQRSRNEVQIAGGDRRAPDPPRSQAAGDAHAQRRAGPDQRELNRRRMGRGRRRPRHAEAARLSSARQDRRAANRLR